MSVFLRCYWRCVSSTLAKLQQVVSQMHLYKVVRGNMQKPDATAIIQSGGLLAMKLAFLLFLTLCLSSCSTLIYKTGWHPKLGTPRATIVAKLGEPVTTAKRKDLPSHVGLWPSTVPLKDRRGREDRYVSRRMIRNDSRSTGALFFDLYLYGAGELLMFPYAIVDHWFPRRRVLAIYYDREDLLQGYFLDPPDP